MAAASARGLVLTCETAPDVPNCIYTDPLRLRQILANLIGNAIKFTDTGSVKVLVCLDAAHEPKLRIDVIDSGIGLTPGQIGVLFHPFSQADGSVSRRSGGTGLGLAISQRLARILGGDISVTSLPGSGSTFSLTLAVAMSDEIAPSHRAADDQSTSQDTKTKLKFHGRILLAEDGPDNQRLIAYLLKQAGLEVTTAENGQVAVDLAIEAKEAGHPFDAILMDMQMPILDGYNATRRLRRAGYAGPMIALTAHAMREDRQKCLDAGCDDYATKPIDRAELLRVVAKYLQAQPDVQTTCAPVDRTS
jgi:CheY-like chemotaxis protein